MATPNRATFDALNKAGAEVCLLPIRAADEYGQARHALSVVMRSGRVLVGQCVVCAVHRDSCSRGADVIVVADVGPRTGEIQITDLLKLTDGIQVTVLGAALVVACKIGRVSRTGRPRGTIFVLGDSVKVKEGSRQLIPNPFRGLEAADRMLTDPNLHDTLIELSKLDGAFIVRGNGYIEAAGVYLALKASDVDLPKGLGARHVAAAMATKRTSATAVVISATDGNVRVFSGGTLVLQMDSEISPEFPVWESPEREQEHAE